MPEKGESLYPNLQEVNINNYCYVTLTQAGIDGHEKHYQKLRENASFLLRLSRPGSSTKDLSDLVETPKLKITPEGTKFQIWHLMYIFGSMFSADSSESPFNSVVFDLDQQYSGTGSESRRQTIDVNDLVNVILTDNGRRILNERLYGRRMPYRTNGPFTTMRFSEASNLFWPEMRQGYDTPVFEKNNIYLPKAKNSIPLSLECGQPKASLATNFFASKRRGFIRHS